jgi:ssRNA-specific RNase YbeY (16S rRNA maturation enzyme)
VIHIAQTAVILVLAWRGLQKQTVIMSMRFEVLMACRFKITVLGDMILCSLVGGY